MNKSRRTRDGRTSHRRLQVVGGREGWPRPPTTTPSARVHPRQQAWDAEGRRAPLPPAAWSVSRRPGGASSAQSVTLACGPRVGWGGAGGPGLRDAVCQHLTGVFVQPACAAHRRLSPTLLPFPDSFARPHWTWRARGWPCQASPDPFTGKCRGGEGSWEGEAGGFIFWGEGETPITHTFPQGGKWRMLGWGQRAARPGSPRAAPLPGP